MLRKGIEMIRNENYKTLEEQENKKIEKIEQERKKIEQEKKEKQDYLEQNNNKIKKNKIKSLIKDLIFCLVVAVILCVLINRFVLFKAYIPSESMVPTLNKHDQIFVTRIYNTDRIKRGEIVVFKSKDLDDTLIKRVIGLPGDRIVITHGKVTVNGEAINENYVVNVDNSDKRDGTYYVPDDSFFFLGDNRPISDDAGLWNNPFIKSDDIIGKAQIRVYPFDKIGFVNKDNKDSK